MPIVVSNLPRISFVAQGTAARAKTGGSVINVPVVVDRKNHNGLTFTVSMHHSTGQISTERGTYTVPSGDSGLTIKVWRKRRHRSGYDAAVLEITGSDDAIIISPNTYTVMFTNP